jgi:hypothetical protein
VHLRLHYLDELRHVYFTRVSVHIGFVTGIKQRLLQQLVTSHVKWLFLCAHMNFGNGHETEPITVKLTSETRPVNLRLHCLDEMRCICFYACLLFPGLHAVIQATWRSPSEHLATPFQNMVWHSLLMRSMVDVGRGSAAMV